MSVAETLIGIVKDNRFTPENLPELEGKLFFEGDKRLPYLVRFTVLLFLSTIIATFGVLQDSTATVIGAMLVAPLMTPMMAITAALVMGRFKRVSESFLIVLFGTALVIGVAFIIGLLTVNVISVTSNSQIAARIRPNLGDLIVAIAAGAAGAFAYSRDDVADSLPGVAIAIALVPPLAVVGLTLSQGSWFAAFGAFLLFLTNFLSILLAGGLVFALLNLSGASIKGKDIPKEAQLKAYRYIVLGVLIVAIPLALTSYRVGRDTYLQTQAQNVIKAWLEESGNEHELVSVEVFGNSMNISLAGADEPQAIEVLGQSINEKHPHLSDIVLQVNFSKVIPVPITGSEDEQNKMAILNRR
jgi:uncharacterized hydrophobic protein (TIGR00271 family)